jgi:sugar lactone lactonase YvrE
MGGGDGDGDSDADTDADGDYDCRGLPEGPFEATQLGGPVASEDLAFDAAGNLVGNDMTQIFKCPHDGSPHPFSTFGQFRAGMRMLPSGDLVIANDTLGELDRVTPDGSHQMILSGLRYPNGVAVDLEGFVYLTEHDGARVLRIDPDTGDYTAIVDGAIQNPNGLTFSPDYRYLYIGSFCGAAGTIHRIEIHADGTAGTLEPWASGVGNGCHDGMAVDACGNVYVADYASSSDFSTRIFRIAPDGTNAHVVIDPSGDGGGYYGWGGTYLPNMDWGTGQGGWDTMNLYFPEGSTQKVYEVALGVPSKPRPYP